MKGRRGYVCAVTYARCWSLARLVVFAVSAFGIILTLLTDGLRYRWANDSTQQGRCNLRMQDPLLLVGTTGSVFVVDPRIWKCLRRHEEEHSFAPQVR